MQPSYSPDGRFWWDGRQWQPVPGNADPPAPQQGRWQQPPPPQQQPRPGPYGPPPQQQLGPQQPGRPQPPQRNNRVPLIIGGIVLAALVIIAIPVTYIALRPSEAGTSGTGAPASRPTLKPGDPITQDKLNKVAPDDFYFDVQKRQLTKPVSLVTSGYFQRPSDFSSHKSYYVNQVGVDHRGGRAAGVGRFTAARTSYTDGKSDSQVRCVSQKPYYLGKDYETGKMKWDKGSDPEECKTIEQWRSYGSDGVTASGLNEGQANAVQSSLRDEYEGFAAPRRPKLIKASGHSYIRQVVDYKPKKLADGNYWGTQIFIWAFKKSGLDSLTWPFVPGLGGGEGLHIIYYYDTKTLLPTAAMIRTTAILDANGKPSHDYKQTIVVNYAFPSKLAPVDLKDTKPLKLKPPEGWRFTQ